MTKRAAVHEAWPSGIERSKVMPCLIEALDKRRGAWGPAFSLTSRDEK